MTSSTQDTTPPRRPIDPADHRRARSARADESQHGAGPEDGHEAPCWTPEEGDYS